jgi:acetyltransferase-like isoleucine patch superfamily enzyme
VFLRRLKLAVRKRHTIRQNVRHGDRFTYGPGTVVWAPQSLSIGDNVSLGSGVRIEVDGQIGDHVLIANSAAIVGRADHDRNQVGVSIRDSNWVGAYPKDLSHFTVVGSDVWIGYGAIVLSGVTIGDSCIVGAGAVVTKSIPSNSIAVGNPAKVIGKRLGDEAYAQHWTKLVASGVSRLAL